MKFFENNFFSFLTLFLKSVTPITKSHVSQFIEIIIYNLTVLNSIILTIKINNRF